MKYPTELPQWWLDVRTERVTTTRIVCPSPALLFSALIASDGSGDADADVYDGMGLAGKLILDLYTLDELIWQVAFMPPIVYQQGIYVVIGTNCESVLLSYLPVKK